MTRNWAFVLSLMLSCINLFGQSLTARDKAIIDSARAKYYNLQALGLESFTCSLRFDFSTIPYLSPATQAADRKLLQATAFKISLDRHGPSVQHEYPADTTEQEQQRVAQMTNLLTAIVAGFFQTWPSKGLQGPFPSYDSQIDSLNNTDGAYTLKLRDAGPDAHIDFDKNYIVTRMVTFSGSIDEHPIFEATPDGLVFVANAVHDKTDPQNPADIRYTLKQNLVDGLRLPTFVNLQVNQNINMNFTLDKCVVSKGKVITLKP